MACLLTTSSLVERGMPLPRCPHHQAARGQGLPNGLELSCPAKRAGTPGLCALPAGKTSIPEGPARRVSFSELLGGRCIALPRGAVSLGNELCGDLNCTGDYLAARLGAPSFHILE